MIPISRVLETKRYRTNKELDAGVQQYIARMKKLSLIRETIYDDIVALGLEKDPSRYKGSYMFSFVGTSLFSSVIYDLIVTDGERYLQRTHIGVSDKGYDWVRSLRDIEIPLAVHGYMTDQARDLIASRLKGKSHELPVLNDIQLRYEELRRKEDRERLIYQTYRDILKRVAVRNYGKGVRAFNQEPISKLVIGKNEYLFKDGVLVDPCRILTVEAALDLPSKKVLPKYLNK